MQEKEPILAKKGQGRGGEGEKSVLEDQRYGRGTGMAGVRQRKSGRWMGIWQNQECKRGWRIES